MFSPFIEEGKQLRTFVNALYRSIEMEPTSKIDDYHGLSVTRYQVAKHCLQSMVLTSRISHTHTHTHTHTFTHSLTHSLTHSTRTPPTFPSTSIERVTFPFPTSHISSATRSSSTY